MINQLRIYLYAFLIITFAMPFSANAETIGLFYDAAVPQIKFAAEDIKKDLEAKGHAVQIQSLASLTSTYAQKKIVIALANNTAVTSLLTAQGGTVPSGLVAQGYGLRTTTAVAKSYWVIGKDANGAMYGGLQMAENVRFDALAGTYNNQEAPTIVRRGIKLNLPFDKVAETYGNDWSTSKANAIANVWDITFWQKWFDTMARNRFNVVSVWSNHPFTSFVKVPGYEDCAINNVTAMDGQLIKTLSIEQKIVFWKEVMAYAHARGFEFYLFNWNLFLDNAHGKYGIDEGAGKVTNDINIAYVRKSMTTLWETYPDLDGFGITQGEGMTDVDAVDSRFLGLTYGLGTLDYAKNHPERNIRIVHRGHMVDFKILKPNFEAVMNQPNITFEMSYKYSLAHMYSKALPNRLSESEKNDLVTEKLKSFLTVRNDDFFYHNWGDPYYARDYVNGMIKTGTEGVGNTGNWLAGFYMGSDSYSPTRTFFSKNSLTQGILEVDRQWYMNMLWGRMSYNSNISFDVFTKTLAARFPSVTSSELFTAWRNASKPFTDLGELICGTMGRDNQWWPEACQAIGPDQTVGGVSAFLTVDDFAAAEAMKTSTLASIAVTASGSLGGKKSAFIVADEMEAGANAALSFANTISAGNNTELGVMVNNLKAMSYLSQYYAYKIRGAIFKKQNKTAEAITAMGSAYCCWMNYSNLMDANFNGMNLARSAPLANWHSNDAFVLKEYTALGGVKTPSCVVVNVPVTGVSIDGCSTVALGINTTRQLKPIFTPTNATNGAVSWISSDNAIATVNSDGLVTAIAVGLATITARTQDGGFSALCNVKVATTTGCIDQLPWANANVTVNNRTITIPFLGQVNTSCSSSVLLTADVEGKGGLDLTDYCKMTYKIDGGPQQVLFDIKNLTGPFAKKIFSKIVSANSKVEFVLNAKNTAADEIYIVSNIKITSNVLKSTSFAQKSKDISSATESGLRIYPNPASSMLNIEFGDSEISKQVKIFNSVGQLIYSTQTKNYSIQVDVQSLKFKGIVMVQVLEGTNISNQTIIVK